MCVCVYVCVCVCVCVCFLVHKLNSKAFADLSASHEPVTAEMYYQKKYTRHESQVFKSVAIQLSETGVRGH